MTWPFWTATFFLPHVGGKKISHRDFRLTLVRNLLAQAGQEQNVPRPMGRPPAAATQVIRLEERSRKHWPIPSATRRRCHVFSQECQQKSFSEVPKVWCSTMYGWKMLSRLPHQGKSLKLFRLFNWTSLRKIWASAGDVRKINLKFKMFINSFLFREWNFNAF